MHISNLPPEVLLSIFCNLSPRDLSTASRVSKLWHALSEDNLLWRSICARHGIVFRQEGGHEINYKAELEGAVKGKFAERKPSVTYRDLPKGHSFQLQGKFLGWIASAKDEKQSIKIQDLETLEIIEDFPVEGDIRFHFHEEYFAFVCEMDVEGSESRESTLTIIRQGEKPLTVSLLYPVRTLVCGEKAIGIVPTDWANSRCVYLYDPVTGECKRKVQSSGLVVSSLNFFDTCLLTGDAFDTTRIWDINTGEIIGSFDKDGGAHILLMQNKIFITSYNNKIKIRDLNSEDPAKEFTSLTMQKNIEGMDIFHNILAVRLEDEPGVIHLYNITTKKWYRYTAEEKHVNAEKSQLYTPPKVRWNGWQLNVYCNGVLESWNFENNFSNNSISQLTNQALRELREGLTRLSHSFFWK